jgi:hypothetical protein
MSPHNLEDLDAAQRAHYISLSQDIFINLPVDEQDLCLAVQRKAAGLEDDSDDDSVSSDDPRAPNQEPTSDSDSVPAPGSPSLPPPASPADDLEPGGETSVPADISDRTTPSPTGSGSQRADSDKNRFSTADKGKWREPSSSVAKAGPARELRNTKPVKKDYVLNAHGLRLLNDDDISEFAAMTLTRDLAKSLERAEKEIHTHVPVRVSSSSRRRGTYYSHSASCARSRTVSASFVPRRRPRSASTAPRSIANAGGSKSLTMRTLQRRSLSSIWLLRRPFSRRCSVTSANRHRTTTPRTTTWLWRTPPALPPRVRPSTRAHRGSTRRQSKTITRPMRTIASPARRTRRTKMTTARMTTTAVSQVVAQLCNYVPHNMT